MYYLAGLEDGTASCSALHNTCLICLGVQTPKYLLTNEELEALRRQAAGFSPVTQRLREAGPNAQMLQFANGAKVTVKPLAEERGSALIRVLIPGLSICSVEKD